MKWNEVSTKILRSLRFGARTGEEIRSEIEQDPNTSPLRSPALHGIAILERHWYLQSGLYSTKEGEIKLHALTEVGFWNSLMMVAPPNTSGRRICLPEVI